MRTVAWMLCAAALAAGAPSAAAGQARFEDVVRNLRNPDAKIRLHAVRLLRESGHVEAIVPMAPLVNDPVDEIQLEAIAAELSFYLVEDVPATRRVALLIEVRNPTRAAVAFDQGPLASWPRPVPDELVGHLLQAVDDDNARVRLEAMYALGVIARPPLAEAHAPALIKALDHYDPAVRAAAGRVIGRLEVETAGDALLRAVNDSNAQVRYAAMMALGAVREARAVQALTDQLTFYGTGDGALAALDALSKIAHSSSVPVFKARLADRDPNIRRTAIEGLGRSGDTSETTALQMAAGSDHAEAVRAAAAFAQQLQGGNYIPRLVESIKSDRMAPQITEYLLELGPGVAYALLSHLLDQDPAIRARVARVLGAIGGDVALAALQPLLEDRHRTVVQEATRAIERIQMRSTREP